MSDYLHHVPGRLRFRSKALRCNTPARGQLLRKLSGLDGVRSVRLNPKAACVTVSYDTEVIDAEGLLALLKAEVQRLPTARPLPAESRVARPVKPPPGKLTAEIGRMALSVLVNKGVSYSLTSLLGVRA